MFFRLYTRGMGLRIAELRKAKGLSQAELGEMAGISRSQLSEIENEAKPANTRRLAAIASALGVTVDALFTNDTKASDYKSVILGLMDDIRDASDQQALIRFAESLAGRR